MAEVEEDMKIMEITKWHAVAKDQKESRRTVLTAKLHNKLY
jgi:hypothetical protein